MGAPASEFSKPEGKNDSKAQRPSIFKYIFKYIWLFPSFLATIVIIIILISWYPYNSIHVIYDANYVQRLSYHAVPESLTLLDPVWGSVVVDDPEKVLACYNLMSSLPFIKKNGEQSIGRIRNRELSGTISFADRPNMHFSIYDSIVVDGIAYADSAVQSEASFLVQKLGEEFYTPENLGRLIDKYTRIVLRTDSNRINLSTTAKNKLREEIEACELLTDNKQLSEALRSRGKAICQIEIYTDDKWEDDLSKQIPQIYIAMYGNGLLAVYDVDISVGSNMHLMGNLQSILSILND